MIETKINMLDLDQIGELLLLFTLFNDREAHLF